MLRQSLVNAKSFYVVTEYFCVVIEFGQDRKFLCRKKYFYIPTKLAKVKRIYVVTEYFRVVIEFGLDKGF